MNALGMARLMAHWESERQRFIRKAHEASTAGRPAVQYLRTASQCEARLAKLVRLTNRAAQPRSAA